jgi:hypothetical protein
LKADSSREKDRLNVAALREIMARAAPTGVADLVNLTPAANAEPGELE